MTAEAVVFGSGRPTILVPELAQPRPFDHVAIAWDGSRVAARAVADAAPLLQRATKISVLTVVGEKPLPEKDPGARLAGSLQKRGLSAEAVEIGAEDCPISTTLQQRAIELGAALLVMGGYGHSRVRDFVLGGATEGVLSDLEIPVLLSH
jgi:nucleotide-binding universal stress UspA family protein